jgi:hypothetical protein
LDQREILTSSPELRFSQAWLVFDANPVEECFAGFRPLEKTHTAMTIGELFIWEANNAVQALEKRTRRSSNRKRRRLLCGNRK